MIDNHWEACWPPGQERLIVADVAAQSDQVLLAVHEPPRLQVMPVPLPGRRAEAALQAEDADQDSLLDELMTTQPREHTLVIPIIGVPGTGKSHIIKWLRAAIPRHSDLVVRHIPREGTSLPKIVRMLLDGLEGESFDEVRRQMDAASSEITTLEHAANRLAFRISEIVQFGISSGWRRAKDLDGDLRETLCEPTVLPALLTDYACRAHLTKEGGPIHRLAGDIVDGYSRPEDGEPDELGFQPQDLTFTNLALRGAGAAARRAVQALQMEGVAEGAAAILSDALDVAAADVIGLGSVSLSDVIRDLRAALLEQGKELVLLFEDMAIMRGLQLDLVDAIATPAVRDGKQVLCTLRVALAITPTYWDEQAPEMLATRVSAWGGRLFSLDVPADETSEVAARLIGRYLNAARLGIEELEARPASIATATPNKCDDCPFGIRDDCHGLFGATAEGHGLFPLTEAAATTASRLANRETFRPRAILSDVVGPVISERSRLNAGQFPSAEGDLKRLVDGGIQRRVLRDLPLGQIDAIEQSGLTGSDRARAETVLRIWDVANSPNPGGVLEALNLPELPLEATEATEVQPLPGAKEEQRPIAPAPEQDAELHAIDQWAGGSVELGAGVARVVRRQLFDELRAGIRWEEIGFGQEAVFAALGVVGGQQQQVNRAVRIEMTAGGGAAGSVSPLITVRPNVASARLLRSLLLRDRHGSWNFHGGADALARVRAVVRGVEADIVSRLAAKPFSKKAITESARIMVLAATGLGASTSEPPLAASLVRFDEASPTTQRTRAWDMFVQQAQTVHEKTLQAVIQAAGRRQGRGADITAFDWTLVDEKKLTRDATTLRRKPKDEEALRLQQELLNAAEAALKSEAEAVGEVIDAIEERIGVGVPLTLKSISDEATATIERAEVAHVLRPPGISDALSEIELPMSTAAAQLLDDARKSVASARDGVSFDALSRMARLDLTTLRVIAQYLELLDDMVTQSLVAAREVIEGGSPDGGGASGVARAALEQMLGDIDQLLVAANGGVT